MIEKKDITIYCENNQAEKKYPFGTTLYDIYEDMQIYIGEDILGAMVNNTLKELDYMVYKPKVVKFIGYSHPAGRRMYERSVSMILFKAVYDLYPQYKLKIEHSVSGGLYCELEGLKSMRSLPKIISRLKERMKEVVLKDIPFEREEIRTEKALKIFEEFGLEDKCTLIRTRNQFFSSVYKLDNIVNYFYGFLVPSTGHLKRFDLVKYYNGMLLVLPSRVNPEKFKHVIEKINSLKFFRSLKSGLKL
jgi:uridine kinase